MKTDIILAGVGGQGILSIATVIGTAAMANNLYIKQAETHGMSQRGGAVQSDLRLSDRPIASDLIPLGQADIILSVEPMEALRYLPFLKPDGWVVASSAPMINVPDYPEVERVLDVLRARERTVLVDADRLATEAGNIKASNMVMLGAATPFIHLTAADMEQAIRTIFGRKGDDVVAVNIEALRRGIEAAARP